MKKTDPGSETEVKMQNLLTLLLVTLLFLTGLVGTVLPVLPGSPLIFSGIVVYGLLNGFAELGAGFLLAQAFLAALVIAADYIFAAFGSHYFGGSKQALFGAAAGLLVGLFFLPAGLILGPFIGATLADLLFRGSAQKALKSGLGASLGLLGALPVKLALETIMIVWFIIRIF